MDTLLIAVGSFVGFIVAYNTYGRWLSRKIFKLDAKNVVPSHELRDDIDFCPTKKAIIFGHHFTSIAGTGPIVGPAIAVFWGWLPALLWVLFGSIFIGAVHDFGAMVVSLRNKGQTIGDVAGKLISPRARILFLLVLMFCLTIVLGIFGLVIALIFAWYPESVLAVWISMPIAIAIGFWVYKKNGGILIPSLIALGIIYLSVWLGTIYPIDLMPILGLKKMAPGVYGNPVVVWTLILFVYCFIASILPVWTLLQPRDFINSYQLNIALILLVLGLVAAALVNGVSLTSAAPAIVENPPPDAPMLFPFLFITVACGAVSGFHSLVSSGTTSKQIACEPDAQMVGYGSMLLEGALAVLVIFACCAGVGMGQFNRKTDSKTSRYKYVPAKDAAGNAIVGRAAWDSRYKGFWAVEKKQGAKTLYQMTVTGKTGESARPASFVADIDLADRYETKEEASASMSSSSSTANVVLHGWGSFRLAQKVGAFIEGGGNFLTSIGLPLKIGIGIMAVLVASFAATTLDTATRLQRYVIQEFAASVKVTPLTNKYAATTVAVVLGLGIALFTGKAPGAGGLILWPVFGATNQLLAAFAFLIIGVYLWRRRQPIWFVAAPFIFMVIIPTVGVIIQVGQWWGAYQKSVTAGKPAYTNLLLIGIAVAVQFMLVWLIVEAAIVARKSYGADVESTPDDPKLASAG